MGAIHDIRFERLARMAGEGALPLCRDDLDYLTRHLGAVGDAFGVAAIPAVPLDVMGGRALARHLARLRTQVQPQSLEQQLALGRLESVYRLLASAVRLAAASPRRSGRG